MKEKDELELLKEFKKESGWSHPKLASHLGVHYQTIQGWLTGKYKPSKMAIDRIRHFLMIKRIV